MLESIFVGMTGLQGFSRGLRLIANNTTNLNTPGFKASNLQFADLFYAGGQGPAGAAGQEAGQFGFGLTTTGTVISFKAGELRQTGQDLDLAVDGNGLFVLKDEAGKLSYTRDGQVKFDANGVLVRSGSAQKVMGLDANGALQEISLAGLGTNAAKATSNVSFIGNLSSTAASQTVGGVKVIDAAGGEHQLDVKFTNLSATTDGAWTVELMEGTTVIGTGQIVFVDGEPTLAGSKVVMSYTPAHQSALTVTLDFSTDVTSFAAANLSTLTMKKQDGYGPGSLSGVTFDTAGAMTLAYSNGQTVKGTRLALAKFSSVDAVQSVGDNQFVASDERGWEIGAAGNGGFGNVRGGMVEVSNVDLSQEFSDLVVMQRGYQASSQVISTANEMLQELFSMKNK